MKRIGIVLGVAASMAAAVLAAGTALAQTVPVGTLDANNLGATPTTMTQLSLSSIQSVSQTFTAQTSGELTSAQITLFLFAIGTPPTEPFTMEIKNVDASGAPVDEALASTTVPMSEVTSVGPDPGSLATGVFSEPASVVAGQQYAIVLTTYDSRNVAVAVDSVNGGSYGGGVMGWQFDPFGQFGTPSQWFMYGTFDAIFAVYVTPPGPTSEADCKKGGYKQFGFKNQGQCIKTVNHAG